MVDTVGGFTLDHLSHIFTELDDVVRCKDFPSAYLDEPIVLEVERRSHSITVSRTLGISFAQESDPVQWVYGAVDGMIGMSPRREYVSGLIIRVRASPSLRGWNSTSRRLRRQCLAAHHIRKTHARANAKKPQDPER